MGYMVKGLWFGLYEPSIGDCVQILHNSTLAEIVLGFWLIAEPLENVCISRVEGLGLPIISGMNWIAWLSF